MHGTTIVPLPIIVIATKDWWLLFLTVGRLNNKEDAPRSGSEHLCTSIFLDFVGRICQIRQGVKLSDRSIDLTTIRTLYSYWAQDYPSLIANPPTKHRTHHQPLSLSSGEVTQRRSLQVHSLPCLSPQPMRKRPTTTSWQSWRHIWKNI